jgi:hypothetical protein
MMLIARRSFFSCVAIRCNNELLRLAKKKQQCTLNTTQLRILG